MADETLSLRDGDRRAYVARPSEPNGRAVVVLHELLGLNDDMRRISDRFAAAGYLAIAPDLFQGLGPKPFCMARAMRTLAAGGGSILAMVESIAAHVAAEHPIARTAIGVAGFCMGGGFAVLAAGGGEYAVAAPFYGDVPRSRRRLPRLCPTVASFGGRDLMFRDGAERLRAHLEEAGVEHDVKTYPDAGHSFMSHHPSYLKPSGYLPPLFARYDEAAAEDAWSRVLRFFDRTLPSQPVAAASGSR